MEVNFYTLWHFIIIVIYLSAIIFFFWRRNDKSLKINFKLNIKDALFTLYIFCIIILLFILATYFRILELHPIELTLIQAILIVFYFVAFIAPVEELLFRGIITSCLVKKTSIFVGLITSAIIFGLVHLPNGALGISPLYWNWKLTLLTGISGLFFGIAYLQTKSIINPILLHAASGIIWVLLFGEL